MLMKNIITIEEMKDAPFHEVTRLDCEDEMLVFTAPVMGKGTTAFIPLAQGATLVYFGGTPDQPYRLRYSQYFQDKIMVSLMISGTSSHLLGEQVTQRMQQGMSFIYSTGRDTSYITYPAGKRFEIASLVFEPSVFEQCLDRFFDGHEVAKKDALKTAIFQDNATGQTFDIAQEVKIVIRQVMGCRLRGNFRRVFLECKLFELLAHYFQSISDSPDASIVFSSAEITKLQQIKKALTEASSMKISIQELCRTYGINRFKLHMGFQGLFNTSVIRYYRQQLLRKAHEQLAAAACNISEAAVESGYNNTAAFSRAFLKEFGYRPSMVKKCVLGKS